MSIDSHHEHSPRNGRSPRNGQSPRNAQSPRNGKPAADGAVRTYRGKRLAELLPQIREELGPDAIILREREGLVGGIGGFFAQRFVEVDARPGAHIDIRDEDEAWTPDLSEPEPPSRFAYGPATPQPLPAEPARPTPPPVRTAAEGSHAPALPEAEQFGAFLNAAAEQAQERIAQAEAEQARAEQARIEEEQAENERTRLAAAAAQIKRERAAAAAAARRERAAIAQAKRAKAALEASPAADAQGIDAEATPVGPAAAAPAAPELPEPAPVAPAASEPAEPAEPTAPKTAPRTPPKAARKAAPKAAPKRARKVTRSPARPSRPQAAKPRRGRQPAERLDTAAAAAAAQDLLDAGIDQVWVQRLVYVAAAHQVPFTAGDLRAAVRATIVQALPTPPLPPAGGARLGFVGPGGAGKTRVAAATAAAYARHSTMPASAITLAGPEQGRQLSELLAGREIHVMSPGGRDAAAKAVAEASKDGLVVVDTPTLSGVDPAAWSSLAEQLSNLELDLLYLVLPASLSPSAARAAIAAAAPLEPSAVVITHADEVSGIGEAVQAATEAALPVAFLHRGLDVDTALRSVTPAALAGWLLP